MPVVEQEPTVGAWGMSEEEGRGTMSMDDASRLSTDCIRNNEHILPNTALLFPPCFIVILNY